MIQSFELPYNFDLDLIQFYKIYFKNKSELIHSIYLPPFKDDYNSAKFYYKDYYNNKTMQETFPFTFEEYQKHIEQINLNFPNKINLLLQQNQYIMQKEQIQKYLNINITKFCVGSFEQAKIIKNYFSKAEIMGSITMKIMPQELNNNLNLYKKYFDSFVLWFPYNRDIELIKKLPKDFKYVLLVNCWCDKNCSGTFHWLANSYEEEKKIQNICPNKNGGTIKNKIFIPPQYLYLFQDYISYLKIQGREYPTEKIIEDVVTYTTYPNNFNNLQIEDFNL